MINPAYEKWNCVVEIAAEAFSADRDRKLSRLQENLSWQQNSLVTQRSGKLRSSDLIEILEHDITRTQQRIDLLQRLTLDIPRRLCLAGRGQGACPGRGLPLYPRSSDGRQSTGDKQNAKR